MPCKKALRKRRVLEDSNCDLCGSEDTVMHALYRCPSAKKFGNASLPWPKLEKALTTSWIGLVLCSIKAKDPTRVSLWEAIFAGIWRARNDIIFNNRVIDIAHIVEDALESIRELDRLSLCNDVSARLAQKFTQTNGRLHQTTLSR